MLVVGVTGGIGSGKSTFARLLEELGAEVIDADELGRRALDPGSPAWHSVVDQFGDEILVPGTMDVDRKRLAAIVFNDREKLAALNAIVHPVILKGVADLLETLAGTDEIVVLDAALIVEMGIVDSLDVLVVVTAEEEVRRNRLKAARQMTEAQIEERMRSQASEGDLLARADIVVRNSSTRDDLEKEAERVWALLLERRTG
jgi:dephospho-CoA kinase